MKLGIFIDTNRHVEAAVGITKAALAKGHEVVIFNMDEGSRLLGNPEFSALCKEKGIKMSFCDHSAKNLNIATEGLSEEIVCGSQYNNAVMVNDSDRVIVL